MELLRSWARHCRGLGTEALLSAPCAGWDHCSSMTRDWRSLPVAQAGCRWASQAGEIIRSGLPRSTGASQEPILYDRLIFLQKGLICFERGTEIFGPLVQSPDGARGPLPGQLGQKAGAHAGPTGGQVGCAVWKPGGPSACP